MLSSQSQQYLTGKLKSPEPNTSRSRGGSVERMRPSELPNIDPSMMIPNARYSISYVPGLSEHTIQTGNTLQEAQMKNILLACEVERLNSINYTLVKENELLKINVEKNNRQVDLETKLAVVLAENEKLNQVIEELHMMSNQIPAGVDESRVSVLARDLEDWKKKYDELAKSKNLPVSSSTPSNEELNNLRREKEESQKKINDLTEKVKALLAENDKLHAYIDEKVKKATPQSVTPRATESVDPLRLKQLQEENEALRNRVAQLERQGPTSPNQLTTQIQVLLAENQKLTNILAEKNEHNKDLKGKLEDLLRANDALIQDNNRLATENDTLRKKLVEGAPDDLKHQVQVLLEDNQKLNNQISQMQSRGREVDMGPGFIGEREVEKRAGVGASPDLQRQLNEAIAEAQRLAAQNDALRRDLETLRALGTAKSDDQRISYLNSEIERLQGHLNNSLNEIQDCRKRYSELEVARAKEIDELRQQFEAFKKASIDAKEQQVKFAAERTAYETQIAQLQQRVNDLENENHTIMAENERLSVINRERAKEIDQSKKRLDETDTKLILENNQLRLQLEQYKANNYDIKQLAIKYGADKAADQSQIKQLKQMNENYKAELEKLYELLNQRKVDFDALVKQNEKLSAMYAKLADYVRNQGESTFDQSEKIAMLQKENAELEAARDEYKKQAERNSVELTRKNKDLVDKIQELDILKMKYEEALANYQALNSKLFEKLMDEK